MFFYTEKETAFPSCIELICCHSKCKKRILSTYYLFFISEKQYPVPTDVWLSFSNFLRNRHWKFQIFRGTLLSSYIRILNATLNPIWVFKNKSSVKKTLKYQIPSKVHFHKWMSPQMDFMNCFFLFNFINIDILLLFRRSLFTFFVGTKISIQLY